MTEVKKMLITSEMMKTGSKALLFTGGACNIQGAEGPIRNPGRDRLATWLDHRGWSYYDPQIHPDTHGREYIWGIDGPQEKKAREEAKIRIYELTSKTISAVTMLEIMDDARRDRSSIVWFNGGRSFVPIGLGHRDELQTNQTLRESVGETIYGHLLAYVKAGHQLRNELALMLADCEQIIFVNDFDELTDAIAYLLEAH